MIGHTSKASNVSSSGLPFLGLPPEMRNAIYEFWAAEYLKYRDPILVSGHLRYLPFRRRVLRAFYEAMR